MLKPFSFKQEGSSFQIRPAAQASLALTVSFPQFGRLRWDGPLHPEVLRDQVVAARTFGWLPEALLACAFGRFRTPPHAARRILANSAGDGRKIPSQSERHAGQRRTGAPPRCRCRGRPCLGGAPLLGAITIHRTRHAFIRAALEALFAAPGTLAPE